MCRLNAAMHETLSLHLHLSSYIFKASVAQNPTEKSATLVMLFKRNLDLCPWNTKLVAFPADTHAY